MSSKGTKMAEKSSYKVDSGISKAERFLLDAKEAGWDGALETSGEIQTVVVTRGTEEIKISWRRGACADGSTYRNGDYTRTLRNAAACLRQLSAAPIAPPARKRVSRKVRVPRIAPTAGAANKAAGANGADLEEERESVRMRKSLPFKISAPDAVVLKAVIGKEIVWENSISGGYLNARVLPNPDQKQLRIEYSPVNRKRIITFAAAGEGYRSVYVESIVSVK
jgi:hypothetical protein